MRTLILVFALIGGVGISPGQNPSVNRNPRLSKAHPSVYITFERQAKIANISGTGEMQGTVWLRLRNNTRWPIVLDMNGVPKGYGDAGLFYDVLSEGKLIFENRCHVCSFNKLGPGRHLVFTVPHEDLVKGHSIRVKFSYGWEDEFDVGGGREVEHFVYFDGSHLPNS